MDINEAPTIPSIFQFCLAVVECEAPLKQIMAMQLFMPSEEVEGYPSVPSSIQSR
jgi:hypothetical protein